MQLSIEQEILHEVKQLRKEVPQMINRAVVSIIDFERSLPLKASYTKTEVVNILGITRMQLNNIIKQDINPLPITVLRRRPMIMRNDLLQYYSNANSSIHNL